MIGKQAPYFEALACVDKSYKDKWIILFFYPEDFSYICPTELMEFAEYYADFKKLGAEIVAVSTDSVYVHRAWLKTDPSLKDVRYPILSDRKGAIAASYGVLNEVTGNATRALFIIDPTNTIRYMTITDDYVGRSTKETYRVLAALQTEKMCAANWEPGDDTIKEVKK